MLGTSVAGKGLRTVSALRRRDFGSSRVKFARRAAAHPLRSKDWGKAAIYSCGSKVYVFKA
jgi:hypothetical protein